MKKILPLILLTSLMYAQDVKSPQQVEAELDQAQSDFETAQKMFIPWYTGPLITGSANNCPKGKTNVQVYTYFDWAYAEFNDHRKSNNIDTIFTFQPLGLVQRGLTDWLDFTLVADGYFKWSDGKYGQSFGDMSATFGFQIIKQTPYIPSVRVTLGETFPTGKYQRLNPNRIGLDAGGAGIFATTVGLNVSKVFWQMPLHPIAWRFTGTYEFPNNKASVKSFNAYGGGFGTKGDVRVGQTLNLDTAIEYSFTQKWVFACDIAYTYTMDSSFKGIVGSGSDGSVASVGAPSSDNLSLAPAIEYNPNDYSGFIGGIWFSVTGRNSSNFAAVILSYTHLF